MIISYSFHISEAINHNEQKESQTQHPSLLDVVKIDGKWAQVIPRLDRIAFLDEKKGEKYNVIHEINWDDYGFKKLDTICVTDLLESGKISDEDFNKVHWGHEQKANPNLRGYVTVFGEYKKKTSYIPDAI